MPRRRPRRDRPSAWQVRRARLSDLDVLVASRRRMWEDIEVSHASETERLDAADRVYRRWAGRRLRNGTLIGFLVEDDQGVALGSGALWLQPSQPRPWWPGEVVPYLMSISVTSEARGQGIASSIVRAAVEWARARGYPRVVLHASPQGRRVYARLGFERTWEMRYPLKDVRLGRKISRKAGGDRGRASGLTPGRTRRGRSGEHRPKGSSSRR